MRKKISYLIIFLATFICFQNYVYAKDNKINKTTNFNVIFNGNGGSILHVKDGYSEQCQISYPECSYLTNSENLNESYYVNSIIFGKEGYFHSGWKVHTAYGYLCEDGNDQVYKEDCSENDKIVIDINGKIDFYVEAQDYIEFIAEYDLESNMSPTRINSLGLGEEACKSKGYIWNKNDKYCNTDNLQYVMCGDAHDIPAQIPVLVSTAVNLLKIATPIILIIVSIITLVKAIMASREDEIKKAQQSLIRKVIAAVMIFMIIAIVQFIVLKIADDEDKNSISSCMSCFLNNRCIKYFKTNKSGEDYCTEISNQNSIIPCTDFYKASEEFTCPFTDKARNRTYTVTFDYNGNAIGINTDWNNDGIYDELVNPVKTNFNPKNSYECPSDSEVDFKFVDDTYVINKINKVDAFTCSFTDKSDNATYTVTFDYDGNIIGTKLNYGSGSSAEVTNPVKTNFKPKSSSECPSDSEVDVHVGSTIEINKR